MIQNAPPTGRRWLVIGSLTSGHAISISIIMTIGLMLPDMTADLGLSPLQQGVLGASATLAVLFLNIPTAWIASRFRPWRMAGLGLIVVSGFTFMQGWAPSFLLLLLGRLAMSMAYSQTEAATALLIQQWSTPRQVARTNGLMISGSDIINGLALLMTPFLIDWLGGWRNTMYLWSGLALLSALSWITLGGERQTPEYVERFRSQRGSPLASIFKYKQLWLLGVGMAGGLALESAFNVFWPTLAQQEFGVDPRIVGLGLAMYMFAAAPAELFVVSLSFLQSRQLTVMAVTGIVTMVTHMALAVHRLRNPGGSHQRLPRIFHLLLSGHRYHGLSASRHPTAGGGRGARFYLHRNERRRRAGAPCGRGDSAGDRRPAVRAVCYYFLFTDPRGLGSAPQADDGLSCNRGSGIGIGYPQTLHDIVAFECI